MGLVAVVREAEWLGAGRARVYSRLIAVAMLICVVGIVGEIAREAGSDPFGRPLATDFDAFWAGARLGAAGKAPEAYREAPIAAVERSAARAEGKQYLPYQYPPVFMLLSLPLGWLPYLPAMAVFLGLGYLATTACLLQIWPHRWPRLAVFALPAGVMNAVIGQNGFLSATCFAGALLLLEKRPGLAGCCLGVFAYKPHLALCVPVALAAARRWKAFVACGATALGLGVVSWAVLGTAVWVAFFNTLGMSRDVLQNPITGPKVITVYEAVRLLGGGVWLAAWLQMAAAILCILAVARVAVRRPGAGAEISAVAAAALLCIPYAMDYDMVCLAVPMAWMAARAAQCGWRAWEKSVLAAAYLLPLVARWLNVHLHLPLAPFVLAALLIVVCARAAHSSIDAKEQAA